MGPRRGLSAARGRSYARSMEPGAPTGHASDVGPPTDDADLQAFMDAVVTMSSKMDIETVLARLVVVACRLTGARYGALGVLGEHGGLREFVTHGVDTATRARIGRLPRGRGVLGHLIDHPELLRLHDLTQHPASVGFPPHHPPMHTFLGLPVSARGEVYGILYLTDKLDEDGAVVDFTPRDERAVVALAAAAGVAVDHARTYRLTRDHESWLEAAAACTRVITGGEVGDATDALVLDVVRRVAGAPVGVVWRAWDDVPAAVAGLVQGTDRPALVPVDDGREIGLDGPAWYLAIPLSSSDRWTGALLLGWPRAEGEAGPQVEMGSVSGLADQVALAYDVVAAQADRGRLAVLEDRDRIARELHDMVIQRLFAIGLTLQAASTEVTSPAVARRLEEAVDDLDDTIKEIRSSIFRLAARSRGDDLGLRRRVDVEVVRARRHLGFLPRLRVEGVTTDVPGTVTDDAVAVVREALANTGRHAHARAAVVDVVVGDRLEVRVSDDGVGLPAEVTRSSGVANMTERAERHGGWLRLEPGAAGGAVLTWSVPLGRGGDTS